MYSKCSRCNWGNFLLCPIFLQTTTAVLRMASEWVSNNMVLLTLYKLKIHYISFIFGHNDFSKKREILTINLNLLKCTLRNSTAKLTFLKSLCKISLKFECKQFLFGPMFILILFRNLMMGELLSL